MSEKGANIDLLFRNGLKDYEVLPPPGVWDGIHPAIKIKSRTIIILRVAAVAAVLLTVGFLTYRWSNEITGLGGHSAMSLNTISPVTVISIPFDNPLTLVKKENKRINNSAAIEPDPVNPQAITEEARQDIAPIAILNFKGPGIFSLTNKSIAESILQTPSGKEELSPVKIQYQPLFYDPENVNEKPVNRWSIAAMASPTYYSSINSGSDALSSQLSKMEQPLFSYSGGVAFAYKISKRFSIQSGLYYSSLGQKVDDINSFSGFGQYNSSKGSPGFEVITTSGTVVASNPDVFLSSGSSQRVATSYTVDVFDPKKASLQPVNSSLNQNFSYLEFPVLLKYRLVDKTIGINVIGGLSYNLLVHNTVTTTMNGTIYPVGDTRGLNPLSLSSSLGMGMEYNISGKLSLNLEPTFRYYLNPFSVTTGTFIHPYSFGIFSGVMYKF